MSAIIKYMKKFFNIFFVILGAIFLILIIIGLYLFIADPYNIKPLLFGSDTPIETSSPQIGSNPIVNEKKEKALETFGIDPASIPSSITPEQESCFVNIVGQARVNEIKAGDSPTATEYFKARGCI